MGLITHPHTSYNQSNWGIITSSFSFFLYLFSKLIGFFQWGFDLCLEEDVEGEGEEKRGEGWPDFTNYQKKMIKWYISVILLFSWIPLISSLVPPKVQGKRVKEPVGNWLLLIFVSSLIGFISFLLQFQIMSWPLISTVEQKEEAKACCIFQIKWLKSCVGFKFICWMEKTSKSKLLILNN